MLAELVKKSIPDFNKFNIKISVPLQDLITKMLKYDPKERITFDKIFAHEFFQLNKLDKKDE